jgi:SMODS and SLOG-associating 2TM effector domain 3/SMODS and SLOG-associating 2TM effector domain 1
MTIAFDNESDMPGLYRVADTASRQGQLQYLGGLAVYLILLVMAAFASFIWPNGIIAAHLAISLFLITLGILFWLKFKRPEDLWYNGRAVAESVKTRAWRWMMRSEPYQDTDNYEVVSKTLISDFKSILEQNRSLARELTHQDGVGEPISLKMTKVRDQDLMNRLKIYQEVRIKNQAEWYSKKSMLNKRRSNQWFWVSVGLHSIAVALLIFRISYSNISVPIEGITTAIGAVLTWLQAKKHNELSSSYALTAHEIVLIRGESVGISNERDFSEFVVNSEGAFSREHTQWVARKSG